MHLHAIPRMARLTDCSTPRGDSRCSRASSLIHHMRPPPGLTSCHCLSGDVGGNERPRHPAAAPAAFFCFVDRRMGPPQWSDLGMFLQTFMLLAVEAGLDTCPQEAWAMWSQSVAEFVGADDDEMLFCGMAIGHRDPDAPVNSLDSERMPFEQWATVVQP